MILLDTNAFIWMAAGETILGSRSRKAIKDALDESSVRISPITPWEISMLAEKKRISLSIDTFTWVDEALARTGVRLEPLNLMISVNAGRLPGAIHGDPADRLIIATARELGCPLLTSDRKILAYGNAGHVITIDAMR